MFGVLNDEICTRSSVIECAFHWVYNAEICTGLSEIKYVQAGV